ncbi:SDR family NAD(P)-dependent oxidoreductase [Leisingera methylohalidivorans]|uniref:Oxidoreductase n=1 Tax=Leisingera methylohalidivorans DSM 14336 TaxID=999552 RepID=V9W0F6_9RHOB|nr:SDR family NAD(P)-dependent oxidoreductase [Leisingera methylohalidivorans]AHD03120.1 hypothetical protein METH_12340 [Leisingera methylohalidivorans DSM 14336]
MKRQGKHAQVTGGGTGIGLATAQTLAAEGVQIANPGRRQVVLAETATEGLHPSAADGRSKMT